MSKPLAYYNEHDRQKAQTLRNLIEEGAIAPGFVDERSIAEVQPEDLDGFTQCHFFAGGGLWSLCLRLAGWPDDRPVWTGSCPCGPFSKAGLRKGFDDPRHLWPQWLRLISVCRPDVLFGEQSDEADAWLDLVSSDLEDRLYAVGSAIIPAAGFGGFHGRHRIGFVADANDAEWWSERAPWHDGGWPKTGRVQGDGYAGDDRASLRVANSNDERGDGASAGACKTGWREPPVSGGTSFLANPDGWQPGIIDGQPGGQYRKLARDGGDADWIFCRDAKWRPVESGTFPLAHEDPARMGRLRLYGDAIDVEAFTNFVGAYLDCAPVQLITALQHKAAAA